MPVIPDARFFARDPESRGNIEGSDSWLWIPGSRASLAPGNDSGLVTRPLDKSGLPSWPGKNRGPRRAHLKGAWRGGDKLFGGGEEVVGR